MADRVVDTACVPILTGKFTIKIRKGGVMTHVAGMVER